MYFLRSCVISFALLRLYCSGEQIQIKMYPEEEISYVTLNSNATVTCEASGLGGKAVTWSHSEKQIANVAGDTVIFSDPTYQKKYEIGIGGFNAGNFTFAIVGFTIQDSGVVSCGVIGANPRRIHLKAFVLPEFISLRVESEHRETSWDGSGNAKVLDLREKVIFSCAVRNSRPKAEIEWLWNGHKVASNISDEAETSKNLYNITSYITVPTSTFVFSATQETFGEEKPNTTTVIENVIDGGVRNKTVVTKVITTVSKPTGEISCKASVGSQSFIVSETILLVDYDTAGISRMSTGWKLTASVTILSYVLLSPTVF